MAFQDSLAGALLGMVKAHLEIVKPKGLPDIPFRFNPTEYQLAKTNTFAELAIPGLESPPLQYVRGGSEKLTLDLIVDTSDTLLDVRKEYTDALRKLMSVENEIHAPPLVKLVWGQDVFTGVMESLTITYTLFSPKGIPLRAKCTVGLKEFTPVAQQLLQNKTASPDFDKSWTVRRGDTLSSLAGQLYQDAARWRAIARANDIDDPRTLEPGRELTIPRLR
jgi:contractile injection system tube protein/LysM domain-containing protein